MALALVVLSSCSRSFAIRFRFIFSVVHSLFRSTDIVYFFHFFAVIVVVVVFFFLIRSPLILHL